MLRHLSLLCGLTLLLAGAVALGIRSKEREGWAAQAYARVDEIFWLTMRYFEAAGGAPPWLLRPAVYEGEGVTRGADLGDGALILLAGYFAADGVADHIRLIRRDGTVVARWSLRALELQQGDNVHGILMDPDGTVTFNLHDRDLVQLDRCGVPRFRTPGTFHHSLFRAEAGGFWALGSNLLPRWKVKADYLWPHTSRFFRRLSEEQAAAFGWPHIFDDTVVRLDKEGRPLREFSLHESLHDSGLDHLLAAIPIGEHRLSHSNSIQELSAELAPAFPMFEAGDLLISTRLLHTLLVVDPDTRKVKWHQTGPWRWQHDARFQPDGTITLFNNQYRRLLRHFENPSLRSNILRVDPASGEISVAMGSEIAKEARFYSSRQGQHQFLPGGDILVVEADRGRVIQYSPQGETRWEFLNRFDADRVGQLPNAYVYPADYFQVDDWSCPPR